MSAESCAKMLLRPLDEMPDELCMVPTSGHDAIIQPPGSKSLTNRALVLAGLASGTSLIEQPLIDADDAHRMLVALEQLGATVSQRRNGDLKIEGCGGAWRVPPEGITLNVRNAGTAMRFLTAAAMLAEPSEGGIVLDGNERMRERPIGELVDAMRLLGGEVQYEEEDGYPPVRIMPLDLDAAADHITFGRTASSQFISAFMLIAPFLPSGLTIRFSGGVTSASYLSMTLGLLREIGVQCEGVPPGDVRIEPSTCLDGNLGIEGFEFEVEPDASGATYFWAAAAMLKGVTVRTPGLRFTSLQADARFPMELRKMGAAIEYDAGGSCVKGTGSLSGVDADCSQTPDAAMTLAVVACFAKGETTIRGLRTLRVKETDRLAAMQIELTKLGVGVEILALDDGDEGLRICPPDGGVDCSASAPRVEFETYDDHRMAMSLALVGLRRPNVVIRNPICVEKTYPEFWADLAALYGETA